jgi:hypothetical protein
MAPFPVVRRSVREHGDPSAQMTLVQLLSGVPDVDDQDPCLHGTAEVASPEMSPPAPCNDEPCDALHGAPPLMNMNLHNPDLILGMHRPMNNNSYRSQLYLFYMLFLKVMDARLWTFWF